MDLSLFGNLSVFSGVQIFLYLIAAICIIDCIRQPVRDKVLWTVLLIFFSWIAIPLYALWGRNRLELKTVDPTPPSQPISSSTPSATPTPTPPPLPVSTQSSGGTIFKVIGGIALVIGVGYIGVMILFLIAFSNYGSSK